MNHAFRITVLASCLAAAPLAFGQGAEDWRKQYPSITIGVTTSESSSDAEARMKPVLAYLERTLKVKVNWRHATDYASVLEGLRSKRVELARAGAAAYAQASIITNGQVEPLARQVSQTGSLGYHSVVVVKSDSPYQKIEDLKGKRFGFNDPNSTSGYQAPRYFLGKSGFDVNSYFGSVVFTGTDDNNLISLMNGTIDGATSWYEDETRSAMKRVESKGLMPAGAVRIIWRSPILPSDVWFAPTWLPPAMRADIKKALIDVAKADPDALKGMTGAGAIQGFVDAGPSAAEYGAIVEMVKESRAQRR